MFSFIAVLVFKLLSPKVLVINRKENGGYFLRKQKISRVNYWKVINSWNAKLSGYC